jgi:acyl-CoA thioesterase-1
MRLVLLLGFALCTAAFPRANFEGLDLTGFSDCADKTGANESECVLPTKTSSAEIIIACVGDSITAGGWPQIMQNNLNNKYPNMYHVINFGESGATLQRHGDSPYVNRGSWPRVLASNADIIIIMLGTNDAKDRSNGGPPNWENDGRTGQEQYVVDYKFFVDTFKQFSSKPTIYTAIPPPLYIPRVFGMNQTVINHIFPQLIPNINKQNSLPKESINVFDALGGVALSHPEYIADGCHPNQAGYTVLAGAMQRGLGL